MIVRGATDSDKDVPREPPPAPAVTGLGSAVSGKTGPTECGSVEVEYVDPDGGRERGPLAARWSSRFERWPERHLIEVMTGMPSLDPAGHGALARAAGLRRW